MRAALIVETLASFGVDARVSAYHEGPVVTQFDIEPGWEIKYRTVPERDKDGRPAFDKDGQPRTRQEEVSRTRVRVNEITRLSNDLALALAAPSLRIEAPVPGRSVVGIEVPNTAASVVTMRSVIETPAFQRLAARTKLALPLGKSVSGEPVVADLAKMPHLLIAGATGAGKSVAINTIISSILMQSRPEEVRFVMIDPKRVELSGFALIPHLAFSNIVVDMEKVVGTLGAVLHEMEQRYKRFAALAVRNIEAYNKHPKASEKLPFWVVIIDELADLMMAAPFEVERQICRLAQLARATGIHLIVATQRPSVDVITGLIKANFPTRIAFAVSSQVDSRTILDMAGAERLLGRGDMLFMPTDASEAEARAGRLRLRRRNRPHRRLLGPAARHALDAGLRPPAGAGAARGRAGGRQRPDVRKGQGAGRGAHPHLHVDAAATPAHRLPARGPHHGPSRRRRLRRRRWWQRRRPDRLARRRDRRRRLAVLG